MECFDAIEAFSDGKLFGWSDRLVLGFSSSCTKTSLGGGPSYS